VSPYLGGFEGFDLTNPRGQFDGEIFHLACSKLGLGDVILSHTILLQIYSVAREFHISSRHKEREGAPIEGFQQGGCNCGARSFVLVEEKRFREFQLLGFLCRCHSAILGLFLRYFSGGLIYIESGTISPRGGRTILWRRVRSKSLAGLLDDLGTWVFLAGPRSIISVVLWSLGRSLGERSNYLGFQSSRGRITH
jgi:hypothetical protein